MNLDRKRFLQAFGLGALVAPFLRHEEPTPEWLPNPPAGFQYVTWERLDEQVAGDFVWVTQQQLMYAMNEKGVWSSVALS